MSAPAPPPPIADGDRLHETGCCLCGSMTYAPRSNPSSKWAELNKLQGTYANSGAAWCGDCFDDFGWDGWKLDREITRRKKLLAKDSTGSAYVLGVDMASGPDSTVTSWHCRSCGRICSKVGSTAPTEDEFTCGGCAIQITPGNEAIRPAGSLPEKPHGAGGDFTYGIKREPEYLFLPAQDRPCERMKRIDPDPVFAATYPIAENPDGTLPTAALIVNALEHRAAHEDMALTELSELRQRRRSRHKAEVLRDMSRDVRTWRHPMTGERVSFWPKGAK